jgi:hypothetical protein
MEIDEGPTKGDVTPFPREDAIMMNCGRHPSSEKHHTLYHGWGTQKCEGVNLFSCTLTYVKIYMYIYVHHMRTKRKKEGKGTTGGTA